MTPNTALEPTRGVSGAWLWFCFFIVFGAGDAGFPPRMAQLWIVRPLAAFLILAW
jgi:hypothetical protein